VPNSPNLSSSLYLRPTLIGTEGTLGIGPADEALLFVIMSPVGSYFSSSGIKPVTLLVDPRFVRAFPGGCGFTKMGSNYAPTLWTQEIAQEQGCDQVLWTFGKENEITEVGAMNIFILLRDRNNGDQVELVTPPLTDGTVLPGVTRRSILEMAESIPNLTVAERQVTLSEVLDACRDGRMVEMFGSGTAAIISPVAGLKYNGELFNVPTPEYSLANKLLEQLTGIYYGKISPHPWAYDVRTSSPGQEGVLKSAASVEIT